MKQSDILKIKKDLPNFPDKVVEIWLLPFCNKFGWPPGGTDNWESVLMYKPKQWWQNVDWNKKNLKFSDLKLSKNYDDCTDNMARNFLSKEDRITVDEVKRIKSVKNFLTKNLRVPEPIIVIETERGYDIADGNHRIAGVKSFLRDGLVKDVDIDVWVAVSTSRSDLFKNHDFAW